VRICQRQTHHLDSRRAGPQFMFNKFDPPVIDGGRMCVPDDAGGVRLYGRAILKV
jgi:hypothetical protein